METKGKIGRGILVISAIVLLFAYQAVPAALAMSGPDFSGWHAGMAMATLAEREIRTNEQNLAKAHDVTIAQNSTYATENTKEYQKNRAEKGSSEK